MAETTTRAYTLRLAEAGESEWRQYIWTTHCTLNCGVWTWGDWLLTLRGSLLSELADKHPERRVILALSWLSVESPASLVSEKYVVARGADDREQRNRAVNVRFRSILKQLGVKKPEEWVSVCESALEARIREDAVWVDRFALFQGLAKKYKDKLSSEWATATFFDLIGGEADYFAMPDVDGEAATEAKDFVIKAGNWLSANWGSGTKSDSSSIAEKLGILAGVRSDRIVDRNALSGLASLVRALGGDSDTDDDIAALEKKLKQLVGWKGRPSKGAMALAKLAAAKTVTKELWTEVRKKLQEEAADQSEKSGGASIPDWMPRLRGDIEARIGMPFRTTKDHIWEYAVMLDHALRRVSAAHTWIKRAEASRQKFQTDAAKLVQVPLSAQKWLEEYCQERSQESGALEEYLIRSRALDGWQDIVKAWKKSKDRKSRIAAAREVQKNWPENKKFGDIQLFSGFGDIETEDPLMSLADDEALCVWHDKEGKIDDSILTNYVAARIAEHDQRRFKVPAYRHPDPLRHPVWVDFGNSRWDIGYSALEAVQSRDRLKQKLSKSKTDATRKKIEEQLAAKPDVSGVALRLWNGEAFESVPLRWQSKRLRNDLALDQKGISGPVVSRADRFGRAAAGTNGATVIVAEVFNQKEWSGRLQANRAELDRLADLVYGKSDHRKRPPTYEALEGTFGDRATKRRKSLRWFLSYSAKLLPAGPWLNEIVPDLPKGWEWKKGRSGEFLKIAANEKRTGSGSQRTRLKLARLPVRVLSFDLGHRYAAACAVWESISAETLKKEIVGRKIVVGGIKEQNLFLHTEHKDQTTGKPRRTIYRRIGGDALLNGKPHPTPWARLDRQFVIKLQGEDKPARLPHDTELEKFENHFVLLTGLSNAQAKDASQHKRVDELMTVSADEVRSALRRHGDIARIANAFQSPVKQLAGGRSYHFFEENPTIADDTPEKRVQNYRLFLRDAFVTWHEVTRGRRRNQSWQHAEASELWGQYVVPLLGDPEIASQEASVDESPIERKGRLKALEGALVSVADTLARDAKLRAKLAGEFTAIWHKEEMHWSGKEGHLRWLRRFIQPRLDEKPKSDSPEFDVWKQRVRAIRNVGGLSIDRIATILKLYQIMRAFHTRPEPSNLRAGVDRIELEAEREYRFGQRILDALDQLRENRIKQLASRLVEAALGIGSENSLDHWERGTKRPRKRIDDPRFAPCQVVIGEDLENYRPEQSRMRSENRRIRDWAARNARKYIMEGCQLNGLYFDEVSPGYTSRQDSRTGAPGVRGDDVPVSKFLSWKKEIEGAKKRIEAKGSHVRDRFIVALHEAFKDMSASDQKSAPPLRFPNRGGELFVSADSNSPAAKGIQADLNAAANIGLKALTDPDWPGAWWYALVKLENGETEPKDFPGAPLFEKPLELLEVRPKSLEPKEASPSGKKTRDKSNVWHDLSSKPLAERRKRWKVTPEYWNGVEANVIKLLAGRLGVSLEKE